MRSLLGKLRRTVRRTVRRAAGGTGHDGNTDAWAQYVHEACTEVHTSSLNIAWMTRHGVPNSAFRYEDMLEFWYSKLIPLYDGMVYDIGAHRGRHTRVFSALGRQVVAFEPNAIIREILVANAMAWPSVAAGSSVEVRAEALCNSTGSGTFTVNTHAPEESGIKRRNYNDEAHAEVIEIPVTFAKLDDLHNTDTAISFIKIDTEGGEVDIIKGAQATLATKRPVVCVEYGYPSYSSYGHSRSTLLDLVEPLGYVAYDIFGYRVDPMEWESVVDAFAWDFILITREHNHHHGAMLTGRLALAANIRHFVVGAPAVRPTGFSQR